MTDLGKRRRRQSWWSRRPISIKAALIIAAGGVVAALVYGLPAALLTRSATQRPPIQRSTPSEPVVTLRSPAAGTDVSRSKGFIASGEARSLGLDTVWILDSHGSFTVDSKAKIVAGKWSAPDRALGDSSQHLPFGLTLAAVLADPRCASRLEQVLFSTNDYIARLPAGCSVFAQVNVRVALP